MDKLRVAFQAILLILAVTSVIGWLVFAAGFGIFWKILAPRDAPLPSTIGVNWTSVLSPMILFGGSAIPLYTALIIKVFLPRGRREKICLAIIMFLNFFYMIGFSTTLFIVGLLLVGGLGDYLKNIFNLKQTNILVLAIGCLLSALPYWAFLVLWPLTKIRRKDSSYKYQELLQN